MTTRIPAAFIRGGTSKALVFHARDLPADRAEWDAIFLRAMGSPDPYGRQLNGMGGGVSSLSKVCVIAPPSVEGADVDYTFVQVQVKKASVDYSGNCGNMSSAIGPFAVDEGLLRVDDGMTQVRIHNTNTRKIIRATFPVSGGRSVSEGSLTIPGVHGTGAPVQLDFLEPGGASTGRLLPTTRPIDTIELPEGSFDASFVDAANACVFVRASQLGLQGSELPADIAANLDVMSLLAKLRAEASVRMGIAQSLEQASSIDLVPLIAMVAPPCDSVTIEGQRIPAGEADLVVRMLSNGQVHQALPLTGSLCTGVAMKIAGSLPNMLSRHAPEADSLRLAMPSGVLTVAANVQRTADGWHAVSGAFFRTTRRLFDGFVYA